MNAFVTDSVARTSRRRVLRRTVTLSVAALAMLGLAACGTSEWASHVGGAPTSSAPAAQPTASGSVTTTGTGGTAASAIGRVFYGPAPTGGLAPDTSHLWSFTPGGEPVRLLALSYRTALENAVVSPDGKRVAWVDDDGYLRVAGVDGTGQRTIRTMVDPYCWGPSWAPDSRRLTVARAVSTEPSFRAEEGVLDVSSGTFTKIADVKGCHPLWSTDGRVLAFPDGSTGRVALTDPTGHGQRFIPNLGGNAAFSSLDIASISPDGSRIALKLRGKGEDSGDVARELDANAVLDTRTGRRTALPLGGRKLLQAYFQTDGTLVARVSSGTGNVLVLVDKDGRKLSETAEPAALKSMQILQIAG